MSDHSELKRLAEAALNDNGDYVALNDYGMAVPPAVVLGLIADLLCPACKGSGEGWVMSDSGPDAHHIQADCQECNARGTLFGAYESMKSQLNNLGDRYVAAGGELLFMRTERDRLKAENEALRTEVDTLQRNTGAAMFLMLSGELAELRKKLSKVHFVCDRLPDQDGCRFIELENPQGESLGDEYGKWEIRPDGLAQLVVEIASPDVKRLAALLECAQGDLKQAMQIIEKNAKDAWIYRFVSQLAWYVDRAAYVYNIGNAQSPWAGGRAPVDSDDVEAAILSEMSKEG